MASIATKRPLSESQPGVAKLRTRTIKDSKDTLSRALKISASAKARAKLPSLNHWTPVLRSEIEWIKPVEWVKPPWTTIKLESPQCHLASHSRSLNPCKLELTQTDRAVYSECKLKELQKMLLLLEIGTEWWKLSRKRKYSCCKRQ